MKPDLFYLDLNQPRNLNRTLFFEGKIGILQKIPVIAELVAYVRERQYKAWGMDDPFLIHTRVTPAQFNEMKTDLNRSLETDAKFAHFFKRLLEWLGWAMEDANFDRPVVRLNPPLSFRKTGEVSPLRSFTQVHRDTWGVNIMSQINLWVPIFPVEESNTFAFYPQYWMKAVPNNTAEWSYGEYLKKKNEGYPLMPTLTEEINLDENWKAVLEPGDLLVFSSAHLHGSLPNRSETTRINFETRMFFDEDEKNKIGAPNHDTNGKNKVKGLFKKF